MPLQRGSIQKMSLLNHRAILKGIKPDHVRLKFALQQSPLPQISADGRSAAEPQPKETSTTEARRH
jgi:hypothetical protein